MSDDGASPPDAPRIEVVWEDERWRALDLEALARRAGAMAFAAARLRGDYVVGVLAADDDRVAALNAEFRGKPAPTNVLSWPAFDLSAASSGAPAGARPARPPQRAPADPPDEAASLGDLALAWDTVMREAGARGMSPGDHVAHLLLHGMLHLLGYDHETDADAALMEGLESRALAGAGLADPYGDEAAAPGAAAIDEQGRAAGAPPATERSDVR